MFDDSGEIFAIKPGFNCSEKAYQKSVNAFPDHFILNTRDKELNALKQQGDQQHANFFKLFAYNLNDVVDSMGQEGSAWINEMTALRIALNGTWTAMGLKLQISKEQFDGLIDKLSRQQRRLLIRSIRKRQIKTIQDIILKLIKR